MINIEKIVLGELKNTTMKKSLMIPAMVILLSQFVFAQNPQWVNYTSQLPNPNATSLAIDSKNNVVWVGRPTLSGGLSKFHNDTWTHYDSSNSPLPFNSVFKISVDGDGVLYIVLSWQGRYSFVIFDGSSCQIYDTSNSNILPGPYISIDISTGQYAIIGGVRGVSILDFKTNSFTNYTPENSQLPWQIVNAVALEGDVKWIGTHARGLARLEDTTWTIYNSTNSGLVYNQVNKIQITPDNIKWITCLGGMNRFDDELNNWDLYFNGAYIVPGAVDFKSGNKAAGHVGFLFFKSSDSTYTYFNENNSPISGNSPVLGLEFDRFGNLWIAGGGGGGLYVYNENGVVNINNGGTYVTEYPKDFKLYQNYPNPFNPTTRIKYEITKGSDIKLSVYDLNGKLIRILENGYRSIGDYEINFDGSKLSSGAYFYKLETESYNEAKRMLLIK